MINLTSENYYTQEMNKTFMSVSQFKMFQECESKALAELKGEFQREVSTALLVGSYVDAFFDGKLEDFKAAHPEMFLKSGGLKSDFVMADKLIARAVSDKFFMKYMTGETQKIFTGEISGVPFKSKLDCYHDGKAIVDLKTVKDFEPIWKNRRKLSFIEAWGYDIQGAVYQELVYQNTGQKLPFFICAVTKEKSPDLAVISIPQSRLDFCLELVKNLAPHFQAVKDGKELPQRCEKCDYCKDTKEITEIIDYRDLNPELFAEEFETTDDNTTAVQILAEKIPEKPEKKHKKRKNKKKNRKIIIKI